MQQRVRGLGLLSAERDSLGVTVSYYKDNWGFGFSIDDYELDRRASGNVDRENLLTGLSFEQRRALFEYLSERGDDRPLLTLYRSVLFANYSYNQQASVAADLTLGIDVFFWDRYANTYSFGLMYGEQPLIDDGFVQAYVAAEFPFGKGFSVGALISGEDQESSVYSQLSLGYSW